jgi:capsular polysaccharide biosynthesis protein
MSQQTNTAKTVDQEVEIDLLELFGYYLSKLPLLIAGLVVGAVIAAVITKTMLPDKFTATSKMYMVAASSDSVVNLADLNLGTSLSSDYVELMKSRPVLEDVIKKLGLDYTYEQLYGMLNLSVVTNTRIVKIAATSLDPEESMEIANQLAKTARTQLPKVMEAPTPSIAEYAVIPARKSSPSMRKNVLIGGLLGLLAVIVVLTILFMMDDTLKTADDVEKMFGVMPLSVIPEGEIEGLIKEDDTKKRRPRKKRKKGGQA